VCLAVVALHAHPRYAIVVAANRDEFHRRPTAAAHWWEQGWLAGRDLLADGTWLGVTRAGRWALLTNVREPAHNDPGAPSRGALVPRILDSRDVLPNCVKASVASGARHNGFNVLAGDTRTAHWGSNRAGPPRALGSGLHGLSNAVLDTPWPKLTRTLAAMGTWCNDADVDLDRVLALLGDRDRAPDFELPATGVPLEWERRLSAPFIVSDEYGTRSSTVLAIDNAGRVHFVERSFDARGNTTGEVRESFVLERARPQDRSRTIS
jgi:uncharacterized protein with NRDE domain